MNNNFLYFYAGCAVGGVSQFAIQTHDKVLTKEEIVAILQAGIDLIGGNVK